MEKNIEELPVNDANLESMKKDELIFLLKQKENESKEFVKALEQRDKTFENMQRHYTDELRQINSEMHGTRTLLKGNMRKNKRTTHAIGLMLTGLMELLDDTNDFNQEEDK